MTSYRSAALLLAASIALLAGCASGVSRQDVTAPAHRLSANQKLNSATLSLTPEVKAKLDENIKFNPDNLATMINRRLELNDLSAKGASYSLHVVIKDVRVRQTVTAVLFGFLAGADSIAGDVELKDATGKVVDRFEISASYALGGWGGGQDDTRMNWLYEEFSKLLIVELKGESAKAKE